jgi:hypothetical protein
MVDRRFACRSDTESCAGGSVSHTCHTDQMVGARVRVVSGPPCWDSGVGLMTQPKKITVAKT